MCTELQVPSSAPNLQCISIHLILEAQHRFPTGDLLTLGGLLTGSGFPRLGRVEFHMGTCTPPESDSGHEFEEAMKKIFWEAFVGLSCSWLRKFENSVISLGSDF